MLKIQIWRNPPQATFYLLLLHFTVFFDEQFESEFSDRQRRHHVTFQSQTAGKCRGELVSNHISKLDRSNLIQFFFPLLLCLAFFASLFSTTMQILSQNLLILLFWRQLTGEEKRWKVKCQKFWRKNHT